MKSVEQRIADGMAAFVVFVAVIYFGGHIIVAWVRGAFAAVIR